jgi:hypothetical protein
MVDHVFMPSSRCYSGVHIEKQNGGRRHSAIVCSPGTPSPQPPHHPNPPPHPQLRLGALPRASPPLQPFAFDPHADQPRPCRRSSRPPPRRVRVRRPGRPRLLCDRARRRAPRLATGLPLPHPRRPCPVPRVHRCRRGLLPFRPCTALPSARAPRGSTPPPPLRPPRPRRHGGLRFVPRLPRRTPPRPPLRDPGPGRHARARHPPPCARRPPRLPSFQCPCAAASQAHVCRLWEPCPNVHPQVPDLQGCGPSTVLPQGGIGARGGGADRARAWGSGRITRDQCGSAQHVLRGAKEEEG